ncbi:snare binding protein, partial [Dendrothele bispora CBS 962.96]
MEITFVNDFGQSFVLEIDEGMELENVMAILEAESGIPPAEQSITYEGRDLSNPKATMRELGVANHAMLTLRRKVVTPAGGYTEQDAEMMRLQLLGDPELMRQLRETQPEIAHAAQHDPPRFAELLRQTRERQHEAELAQQREIESLNADPYDIEAQRRIEEAIREKAVMENLQHAFEYSPEFFAKVQMLYVDVEINGHPVKAFVDTGAQQTTMSPDCAESCNIMRLLDRRFGGIARGVGTAAILGKIHSCQLKVADLFLPCSINIIEDRSVDFILGLDMLKAHQACLDLKKGVLRIQNREIPFLSEHELPQRVRDPIYPPTSEPSSSSGSGPSSSGTSNPPSSFPGSGATLGGAPTSQPPRNAGPASGGFSEEHIQLLMNLGVSREVAISTLTAAGGNIDVAASLLF